METIQKCVDKVLEQLKPEFNYSESNYQRALAVYLSQYGSVELETVLSYNVLDGKRKVTVGSGRLDIVWVPHENNNKRVWILELKVSPKYYNITSFFSQVQRYCHHYRIEHGECEGVVICFSPTGSLVDHCCKHVS